MIHPRRAIPARGFLSASLCVALLSACSPSSNSGHVSPAHDAQASDDARTDNDATPGDDAPPGDDASPSDDHNIAPDVPAVCASGQTRCGAVCVDLMTTPEHCGRCGALCPTNEFCRAGACASDETLQVSFEPASVPTGGYASVRVTASGPRGMRDVTRDAALTVDGMATGDDTTGTLDRTRGLRYLAPASTGSHVVRATLGAATPGMGSVTVRRRAWAQLGGGALRSAVPTGDRAVVTAPSVAVASDTAWIAYTTRMSTTINGRAATPTVVRVLSLDLTRPAAAPVEVSPMGGLAYDTGTPTASARRAAVAMVPQASGAVPCVAFEHESSPWASSVRVRCRVGGAWREVPLPAVNRADPVGSLAFVANAQRADLYWVNDTLGQVVHVPVRPENGLDWSAVTPVASAHYDVDVFENIKAAYDRNGQPVVMAVTVENLPRVVTVARRYDVDGARPSDAFAPWFGDLDQTGMPSLPIDRARHRQTGGTALAAFENRVAFASGWRAGATAFRLASSERAASVRVVETGVGARPTVAAFQAEGTGTDRSAINPSLAYDGRGRLLTVFEGFGSTGRRVYVSTGVLTALTGTSGPSRATSSRVPTLVYTGRDLEELVVVFSTFNRSTFAFRGEGDAFTGLEAWGWM